MDDNPLRLFFMYLLLLGKHLYQLGEHRDIPCQQEKQCAAQPDHQRGDIVHNIEKLFEIGLSKQQPQVQKQDGCCQKNCQDKQIGIVLQGGEKPEVAKVVDKMGAAAGNAPSAQQRPYAGVVSGQHLIREPAAQIHAGQDHGIEKNDPEFIIILDMCKHVYMSLQIGKATTGGWWLVK